MFGFVAIEKFIEKEEEIRRNNRGYHCRENIRHIHVRNDIFVALQNNFSERGEIGYRRRDNAKKFNVLVSGFCLRKSTRESYNEIKRGKTVSSGIDDVEKMIEKSVENAVNKFAYGVDREVLKGKRDRACQENGQKRNESRFNTLKSIVVFYSDRSLCDFIDKSHMLIPALIPYRL